MVTDSLVIFRTPFIPRNRIPYTERAILDLPGEPKHKTRAKMPPWSAEDGLRVPLNSPMLKKKNMSMVRKKMMVQHLRVKTIRF